VTSSLSATEESILWEIRMPRVVLAALVGGMLSLAGATYQGVFRNPLVDPYLLGVAAGAGLGATLAIAYLPDGLRGQQALPAAAFVGGAAAVFLTYSVGRSSGRERDATTLVLAGVTVASFFTALQTFVQQQNADTLQQVYTWILGSIPSSGWSDVVLVLPYVAVATVVILVYRRVVDVLSLGDEEAASLGVDVRRVRLVLVVAATVGTAAAVAICGLIGFVGIIVPHAIRMLAGVGYRALLPLSVIVGAGFLVLADIIARTALSPGEIPLGIVTAFFGAPFFALVLRSSRGGTA
jgi:iron complex transport system permease protein